MDFLKKLSDERKSEIKGVLLLGFAAIIFLALARDAYHGNSNRSITGLDLIGSNFVDFIYVCIGHSAHVLYLLVGAWGIMQLRHQPLDRLGTRILGGFLILVALSGFMHINFDANTNPGGIIGSFFSLLIEGTFGRIGSSVIALTTMAVGTLLATEFLFIRFLQHAYHGFILALRSIDEMRVEFMAARAARKEELANRPITVKASSKENSEDEEREGMAWKELFLSLFRTKKGKVKAAVAAAQKHEYESVNDNEVKITVDPDPQTMNADDESFELNIQLAPAMAEEEQLALPDEEEIVVAASIEEEDEIVEQAPVVRTVEKEPAAPVPATKARLRRKNVIDEIPFDYEYPKRYTKPSITMFEEPPSIIRHDLTSQLRGMATLLEEKLKTFGIEAKVTDVTRGPTLTRFELEPASGIKVARFIALTDDLALALKAQGVRVEAPIPGKGRVGIEIPNEEGEAVMIRELLQSKSFNKKGGQLTLALGKDISGDVITADLATMPHLLVAGATGAGKTVCVKTILASLLASKSPEELQLMLIDPKMVELSIFNDIPHLMTPVVIDPKKAAGSLTWLINEMEERYRLFAHLRVRNIEVYNESVDNGEIEMEGEEDDSETENVAVIRKLPYIVCIIDELADLMIQAKAEVEDSIARLAQLARAVGIHMIIATQRPSVDVLTGVIKANFPTRISFQVSSRVDSRCILDEIGAERLIGKGDMLYLPAGSSKPVRIQGAFVSDEDMNDLISYLKRQAPPQYRDEIENFGKKQETEMDLIDDGDELFEDAVRVVTETGQASISMVQRRLRVGYTRAARLIDMMEMKGIVGPHLGSKAREILVSSGGNKDEVA